MVLKNIISFIFLIALSLLSSCKDGQSIFEPNRVTPPSIHDREAALNAENIGRSSWQKPDFVVNKLGDINGKTIADIGAGTGYFVLRLAYRNAKVLAIDIDPLMINYIEVFKENLPKELHSNIKTRLAKPDNPMLLPGEVDKVIIINTISYIDNLEEYLKIVKSGIKPGGSIMILDYKNKIIDIPAPPLNERTSIGSLQTSLANAGYNNIIVDDTSLDYQYIVTAEVH